MTITTADNLGALMRLHQREVLAAISRAHVKAALQAEALVAADTPVSSGLARAAWRVRLTPLGPELVNDAPHAGIVELGSRPHMPPVNAILAWLVAKEGGGELRDPADATPAQKAAAWAIALHIKKNGTKPHYMVKKNLRQMKTLSARATRQQLQALFAGSGS